MLAFKNYSVIGDPHITHKSLDRAIGLFDLVEAMGLPAIWLGDLLDTKEVIRGKCLNLCIAYFQRSKLHHYVIIGNHDYFNLDCDAHALEALKLLPNVTIVDKPTTIANGIVAIPYYHDQEKLRQALVSIPSQDETTLFAHLEVTQFDFGNGHICTKGLSIEALVGFKQVISGHFHKFQESGNLTYLGTPFSHSFGEANQVKYIGMYDAEKDQLRKAETPFPRHISIEQNCDDPKTVYTNLSNLTKSDLYRIILTGEQANIDQFPKHSFEDYNIKWVSRPSDFSDNDVTIEDTSSNESQFRKWATEVRKMDDETVQLGLAIMEACK